MTGWEMFAQEQGMDVPCKKQECLQESCKSAEPSSSADLLDWLICLTICVASPISQEVY